MESTMDTRRISRSQDASDQAAELGTETVSADLVELVELRYVVSARGRTGIGAIVPAIMLLAALATIAALAIATSTGWSVLNAWSG